MKMLAFLAGELSNAAYYLSTFANVNKEESNDVTKSFGVDWKPFDYSKRLKDAKLVDIKKRYLMGKKVKQGTTRNNITRYIRDLKSRQEQVPLVGN